MINTRKFVLSMFLCILTAIAYAQEQKIVSGLITEGNGNPLTGVTVIVQGSTGGTMTDADGRYSIRAKDGDVIEFRFIGFVTDTRKVDASTTSINIQMVEESANLDDVVVIAYGQQKKESVVSSINAVGPKELAVTGRNLTNTIAGQIAGIIAVQPSGEPGYDDSNFWVRGVASYAGGTSPLVLVDGVPRSMSNITVDEIETFTVLKDAAATAVYGAEGANGVVLITTKRGQNQKTQISFNTEHAIKTPIRLPQLMDSYNYLSLFNEALWNNAGNPDAGFIPQFSDEILEKYRTGADPDLYPSADWMSLLRDNTDSHRYTLNLRGGRNNVRFFASGGYYVEGGIYKGNPVEKYDANVQYERYNLRSNIDIDITNTTLLTIDVGGNYVKQNAPSQTADVMFSSFVHFPTHIIPLTYSDGSFSAHPQQTGDMTDGRYNPYNLLNNTGYSKSWAVTAQSKVGVKQKLDFITKGLSWRGAISFDASMASRINRAKVPETYFADGRDAEGNLILRQITAGTALGNPTAGSTSGTKSIYTETAFDYARIFAQKHDVSALLLYNQKERQVQVGDNGLQRLPYRNQSVVARATYGFDTRYLIEASFGATGSENFAEKHRWGIFPAVGAAWWASHEGFMQSVQNIISKLKFRGSYGVTGNDDIGDSTRFPYRGTVTAPSSGEGYSLGFQTGANNGKTNTVNGIVEANFARPGLTWEIDEKTNFGLDLGLLRGAVDLSVDYFHNYRYSILTERTSIQTTSGFQTMPWQNYGKVENNGVDANIVIKQSFGKFNISARGNFTFARNKILEQDEVVPKDWYQLYTSNAIGTPKLFIAEGLYTPDDFNITEDINGKKTYILKDELPATGVGVRNLVAPGDIKYKDLNGDGVIDDYDATYSREHHQFYSTAMPEIVYGFGINAEYWGFNLGIFFQGVSNVSANLLASRGNFMPFIGGVEYQAARVEATDRWTAAEPYNQDALFPRMHPSSFSWNEKASTWWYRDASFLRLKNVELGYTFSPQILKKVYISSLRLYVQGLNLYTWDKVKYWDPEQRSANSGAKYPLSSAWTFGLDIKL
ncbi:MAG: TonB-dependent receptor [Prevotellaceae bacterium]|jgi:TonB-linked SusC/RagA family outer membrane protein|nr:TonB-dependent receptor [Prevotellaceae bacterium]